MLWRRALCNNQVFSFSYEGLSNETDVPSREVERAENCKVKRSMGVLDLHPDSSALSVSPILGYSCKYFFRYSGVQLPAVNFLVAAIMTVCLGIGGRGGGEGGGGGGVYCRWIYHRRVRLCVQQFILPEVPARWIYLSVLSQQYLLPFIQVRRAFVFFSS